MRLRAVVTLAAILVLISCSRSKQQAVFIDPALATLTPPDATLLVGARLDKLRQTATYQRHFAGTHFPALDRFGKETGLNPQRDLWEVLYSSNGSDGVLMARGRFSPVDLEPRLQREGAVRSAYRGYSLFGDERTSTFFMNQTTALSGSTASLKRIIDRQNSSAGERHGIPDTLLPLVERLPADTQFWAVFTGRGVALPVPDSSNLGNVNSVLRTVSSGTLAADLRSGLDARALVTCTSNADAKQMSDALQGLLAIARATSVKKPDLVRALDTIHVSLAQRDVSVTANVPQELVDRVVAAFR
jgi:hypothetical protein